MRKVLNKGVILLVMYLFIGMFAQAQSNILSTNKKAENVLLGNYNPLDYQALKVITHPDSISKGILREVSPDSMKSYILKLGTFRNRNTGSDTLSQATGIGAARRWVYQKFDQFSKSTESRLLPSYLQFDQNICDAAQHRNIFAVLPGRFTGSKSVVILEAHIDSRCDNGCDTSCIAEGIEDNASGTALVLELARVMSRFTYNHSIVFLITIGEEQGLYGAEAFAKYVENQGIEVKAVLNNDVIGGVICGNTASPPGCSGTGSVDSTNVRLFSFGGFNSPHKGLARFVKHQYLNRIKPFSSVPMNINIMTPEDRTGRGGDHIPFRRHKYTAIRFTAANENGNADAANPSYTDRQHTSSDILGYDTDGDKVIDSFFVDFNYLARNAVINGCAAGMAAIGPTEPDFELSTNWVDKMTVKITSQTFHEKYKVGVRTLSNDWDTVYTFSGLSFDFPVTPANYFISVASVDAFGVESLFPTEKMTLISGINPIEKSEKSIELLPNKPNPADESTTISVLVNRSLPYKTAGIRISDLNGRLIEWIDLELKNGLNEVDYNHGYHQSGVYLYSLILDGMVIETKRMVFSN
ncbi:MAG: M28 family peptidase [Flavobacteriales bacterium]|nr:M28 family peptidase [Flavobacteriales bacterium]